MSSYEKICDIARSVIGISHEDEAKLVLNSEQVDSLDLTEIILEVEEEFDLIVEDEESIRTIGDLVARVDTLIA